MSKRKFPLESCANGCGVPPKPPSLVICGPCQDKITDTLRGLLREAEEREKEELGR